VRAEPSRELAALSKDTGGVGKEEEDAVGREVGASVVASRHVDGLEVREHSDEHEPGRSRRQVLVEA